MDFFTVAGLAGPPVIGAFIGYLTNKIAIKMLFRPLKPWKVFGVRVPMTPGVIPSKRYQLAENIGEMVGEHLLTSREIGQALSNEPFQDHLNELVQKRAQQLLNKEFGPVVSLIPENFTAQYKVAVQILKQQIVKSVQQFLENEECTAVLRQHVIDQCNRIGDREIRQIISADSRNAVYMAAAPLVIELLSAPETQKHLSAYLHKQLELFAESSLTLKEILPQGSEDLLEAMIRNQTPELLDNLGKKLQEPLIRKEILAGIMKGVDHFIDSLGSVGAMARGFIDVENLKTTIDTYLDEKEDDICTWLQKEEVRQHVEEVFGRWAKTFFNRPLSEIFETIEPDNVRLFSDFLAGQLLQVVVKSDHEQIADFIRNTTESWLSRDFVYLKTISEKFNSNTTSIHITEVFADRVIDYLRSERAYNSVELITDKAVDMLLEKPVGKLGRIIPSSIRQGVADYAVLTTNRILLKEVPGLVKSLKINNLVTEKVNSLDLLRLERLLLSIMEEQFKYINLFGALLGFVIGCLNLIFLQLV